MNDFMFYLISIEPDERKKKELVGEKHEKIINSC